MAVSCSACATENPDAARFCMSCGAPLDAPVRAEERRLVTIVFADLVGFTERSDRADPEDVRRTLIPFHRAAKEAIEGQGGVVDKFIGDAAMGVFGAPVAHEDDPVRAVRAARALVEHVDGLRERDPDVAIRVAVETGEAVVSFGAGPQIGEAVAGDVVNTTSRMQALAPRDGVLVGERTWEAVRERFDAEAMDAVEVKGKSEPLRTWRILGERDERPASEATPLIGRRAALAELSRSLEAARSGGALLRTLVADAGMGKSRLVREFRNVAGDAGWWEVAFQPAGEDAPFAPLARLLRSATGDMDARDPDEEASAIAATAVADPDEAAWIAARLAPLLGSSRDGAFEDPMDTASAIGRVLRAHGGTSTVCVLDDVHRADPWVREVLLAIIPTIGDAPILVLATSRPEGIGDDRAAWHPYRLPPLSEDETARLMAAVLGASRDDLGDVATRAGGNPLFALEFARSVHDLARERAAEVPTSIRAVIGARLDALAPPARALILDAAIFGLAFHPEALENDDRTAEDVAAAIDELERRSIVERRPAEDGLGRDVAAFTHALIQEEAYGRLARGVRARRHLDAARWIERTAGEDAPAFAGMLATHLLRAVEAARAADEGALLAAAREPALRWLLAAADEVFRLDTPRAFELYAEALALEPVGEDRERALYGSGLAGRRAGRLDGDEILRRYEAALASARQRDDPMAVGQMLTRVASQRATLGDTEGAIEDYDEAIALLEPLPPGRALASALAYRAEEDMFAGRSARSLERVERSLAIARGTGDDDIVIMALHLRGDARCALGDLDGVRDLDEALAISRRAAGASEIVTSLSYVADWRWQLEGCDGAVAAFEESAALAAERGAVSQGRWSRMQLGMVLLETGAWDRALELTGEFLPGDRAGLDATLVAVALTTAATVHLRRGTPDRGPTLQEVSSAAEGANELQAAVPAIGFAVEAHAALEAAPAVLEAIRVIDERTRDAIPAYRAGEAARVVRAAVRVGEPALARAFLVPLDAAILTPRDRLFRDAAAAYLREIDEGPGATRDGFVDLMERWRRYGHAWEELQAAEAAIRSGEALGVTSDAERARAAELAAMLRLPPRS